MLYTVKCTNIRWSVTADDVAFNLPENATDEDIEKEIAFIKQDLPDEVTLKIEADSKDEITKDYVSDELSEQTYWLHEGCDFEIV